MVVQRRKVALYVGIAVVVIVIFCGGPIAFLLRLGPIDQVPADDEMPQATDVPTPAGLELVDGYCSGGSAGCYKGIQVFHLRSVDNPDERQSCATFEAGLTAEGWTREPLADLASEVGYTSPTGDVAARCEAGLETSVTLLWPSEIEFLPFVPPD